MKSNKAEKLILDNHHVSVFEISEVKISAGRADTVIHKHFHF